jgi:hypothetical protein
MAESEHKDSSRSWLIFFFVCFALTLIGIVVFFARDINKESQPASTGSHSSMILPSDKKQMHYFA